MNRDRYRLVRNAKTGLWNPVAECARGRGKHGPAPALLSLGLLLAADMAGAELPVACGGGACGTMPFHATNQAAYSVQGSVATVSQAVDKAIVNFRSFNLSPGHQVVYQRVEDLANPKPVPGASFTNLSRIWDANPSVIAGTITQAAGQKANVILVNTNGIAFVNGARVDLNTFTASSLNIADTFVLDQFLTNQTQVPQFEGTSGFVKVFENAQITAGSQGRVMLLAPTVVNKGRVSAPDGQVIAAAASKVYLRAAGNSDPNVRGLLIEVDSPASLANYDTANASRDGLLDGQPVVLADPAHDKLGHVTNLGELAAARGNVSMVGFAVNQLGRASATTSVVANGSVYLMAKDRAVSNLESRRGGRVTLGGDSRTEVLPETADATGTVDGTSGEGLAYASQVKLLGQDIRMEPKATIVAPAGVVEITALDDPSSLGSISGDPFRQPGASYISNTARVHIARDARIDVAGLEGVEVDVARNTVEVELRGDELKDSPVNRDGPLRGKKAYLDIGRALDNAAAGKNTLIARDSLESYRARIQRSVAERSTGGGVVRVRSQGEVILERGALLDVSGGSIRYTPNAVKTTLLAGGGAITDIADALAEVRYDGIVSEQTVDFGRWGAGVSRPLAQATQFDPGYKEGKAAGAVEVLGMRAVVLGADIAGRVTVGERQQSAGRQPEGARLILGSDAVSGDYKLNQRVEIAARSGALPDGFQFGQALDPVLRDTLTLGVGLLGQDRVANLVIHTNKSAVVNAKLTAPQGGSISLTAKDISVNADMRAAGGSITLSARGNDVDIASSPLSITVAQGVTLDVAGTWTNDRPGVAGAGTTAARVNGGGITLSAVGDVSLGDGSILDASGGGWLRADGKLVSGNGGRIRLEANAGAAAGGSHPGRVILGGELRAYGLGKGGKLTLSTRAIRIDRVADDDAATLDLTPDFFRSGGFADFDLTGRDGVTLAGGVGLYPATVSLELLPGASLRPGGTRVVELTRRVIRPAQDRQAANLSLSADAIDLGDLTLGAGSVIQADPGARINLNAAHRLSINGRVTAQGGSITATLNRDLNSPYDPTNSLWLGAGAVLDATGVARTWRDAKGWTTGEVLGGGTITVSALTGYLVAEAGVRIDVSGATPVRLDLPNDAGGVGRLLGSDAGSLSINAREGILLDATLNAQPGAPGYRGGQFNLRFGYTDTPIHGGYPGGERVVSLADSVPLQTTGLTPGQNLHTFNGQARLGAAALEAAGFDTLRLRARDRIRLEDGLRLGEGRALPPREVMLDSPNLETAGGNASLRAEVLRLGNYDEQRQAAGVAPASGLGRLTAHARLLELAGRFGLGGMAEARLTGEEEIRLAGIVTSNTGSSAEPRPVGLLTSAADLTLKAGVVVPVSYHQTGIQADGRTVSFGSDNPNPVQPLSAGGSLTVKAAVIEQGGKIWAPFGQIDLDATTRLELLAGSLTSVAAAEGSLIPFGKLNNGRAWVYEVGGRQLTQRDVPQKAIRLSAPDLVTKAGTVDLSGGGDLQGWEFTVGPGGSRDILADSGVYAILPNYGGRFAPGDSQENAGFDRAAGDAVYLSGLPGLPAGVYTLLPAHYALLPGGHAIRLGGAVKDLLPHQSYTRQDGVHVVSGYLTDGRDGAPRDGRWSGFQVLTREQVLERSELTLTRASVFFADRAGRPQDAGLLQLISTGQSLSWGTNFKLQGAAGGRGGGVDISLPDWTLDNLAVDQLNALKAKSLLVGGTRSLQGDSTTLTVGANTLSLVNDADHPLTAEEVILAARNTLTLAAGSRINALGAGGDIARYTTTGGGALIRAAATSANFTRSSVTNTGTLNAYGDIHASDSILLDAAGNTNFTGAVHFSDAHGRAVAGNLALGGTRVSFGAAPTGTPGLVFSQTELNALGGLASLKLTSYSTFDFYGDVNVGGVDAAGKPTLKSLSLLGAGLAGLDNAGKTARLRAERLLIANPSSVAFPTHTPGLGSGQLEILADTLVLGAGEKAIKGYAAVAISANELVGSGTGTTRLAAAATTLRLDRLTGAAASDQSLVADGTLEVGWRPANRALDPVTDLGPRWALAGTTLGFDTHAVLPSGRLRLTATAGDLRLGPATAADAHAVLDVAGRAVGFFDVRRATPGGRVELTSVGGNVVVAGATRIDVSGPDGADAGALVVSAGSGELQTSADTRLLGLADGDGEGGRFELDVARLAEFSDLNAKLQAGGFHGARSLRVRDQAAVIVTGAVTAGQVRIAVDRGGLTVSGELGLIGPDAGEIALYARDDLALVGARLLAAATGAGEDGGRIELGTSSGRMTLDADSQLEVGGGAGGNGGRVTLRVPRVGNDLALHQLMADIRGAESVTVEGLRVYAGIATLTATGGSSGSTLSLATVNSDNTAYAANFAAIRARLARPDLPLRLRAGVEARAPADLTLNADWNLASSRPGGEPGLLTLRAAGHLRLNNHLSDGFNVATPLSGTAPATLLSGDSWGYRLVAGADLTAADPLAVRAGVGDVILAAGKLIRTGSGDIRIAAGRDVKLDSRAAAIYTAGRLTSPTGLTPPTNAQFSQGGGWVIIQAGRDITAEASTQLYSNWLFRQGGVNAANGTYTTQPAWWVRFDQFQQGVGTLGGGDVSLQAGRHIVNVSASTPSQGWAAGAGPDNATLHKTGGGDLRVVADSDLLGGQYYVDRGELVLKAGGRIDSGRSVGGKKLYTVLALGDARARVQAGLDVNIHTVLNPHLVVQSNGSGNNVNIPNAASPAWSLFSTYGPNSSVSLASLMGNVTLHNGGGESVRLQDAYGAPLSLWPNVNYRTDLLSLLPPSLEMIAHQGNINLLGTRLVLAPSRQSGMNLLARDGVSVRTRLVMSDMAGLPDAVRPTRSGVDFLPTVTTAHAAVPVHRGDFEPSRVYAINGDVVGEANTLSIDLAEAIRVRAGGDILNLGLQIQHANSMGDLSSVVAGGDIRFDQSGTGRNSNARIWVAGPGRMEVIAGHDVVLGSSSGIVSRGDLDNAALPKRGADLLVAAGVGAAGLDYAGAVDRLASALESAGAGLDEILLWQARWLTGNAGLSAAGALPAVRAVAALNKAALGARVREWLYTALRDTGRDFNNPDSPFAGKYGRGYTAVEFLFPGITETDAQGRNPRYKGDLDLFASRIKTERGGGIDILVPGGQTIVGLANTPASLVNVGNDVLGIVTVEAGDIRGFSRDDILVNQSRILTVGGGHILLWSSEGDIDAGKGKKTAAAVPPPVIKVDSQGNVTQELQGVATGSGIGALIGLPGIKAGDVDLVAPKGTVNAGDAGIRAGNLNIAAQLVLGAENIQVTGTSTGVPVADTSGLTAGLAGNSTLGDTQAVAETTRFVDSQASDGQKAAEQSRQALASFRPSFITVEVLGFGETGSLHDEAQRRRQGEERQRGGGA